MQLVQGGGGASPPPPPPGPSSFGHMGSPGTSHPSFPGFRAIAAPPAPGSSGQPGTSRSTASDNLRSTFKCPKFLGEARHWKVWNQGFIRFLSINRLDHVIEEAFLVGVLNVQLQEDNKLVYYILEDALAGSTLATKYLRRAAL